jgi:DNA-binding transcriptional LysR family regulator
LLHDAARQQRARKLRDVRRLIVASPDWVARHPEVKTPDDLPATDVFGYTNLPRQRQIGLMRNDGGDGRLRANNADAMLAAVEAGLGVAVAPDFIVGTGLATGRLVTILSGWSPRPLPCISSHRPACFARAGSKC